MNRLEWVVLPFVILGLVLCLSSCVFLPDRQQSIASADALDKDLVSPIKLSKLTFGSLNEKRNFLGAVVLDSEQKCQTFINNLVLDEGNANLFGDSFSTLFSALATVAKPINTVHGLTASATIASGTKNAYLSGYFAKASIANFGTALQSSYFTGIKDYLEGMPGLDDSADVAEEVGKIQTIHSLCSLSSAQSVIDKTLLGPTATGSGISVAIDFDPKVGTVNVPVTMSVTLINGSGKDATLQADMSDALTSSDNSFSIKDAKFGGSCTVASIKSADDGKSFTYQKGAVVPSGGCRITVQVTLAAEGSISSDIKANALKTDQGGNSSEVGPIELSVTKDGTLPKNSGAATSAAASAAPSPGSVAPSPTAPTAKVGARASSRATHACRSVKMGQDPCGQ